MDAIIVHFDHHGDINYLVNGEAVRLFIVDERAPHDRVFEWLPRNGPGEIIAMLGESEIGNNQDARHEAVAHFINNALAGKPHLRAVEAAPPDPHPLPPPRLPHAREQDGPVVAVPGQGLAGWGDDDATHAPMLGGRDEQEVVMLSDELRADGWIEHDGGDCPVLPGMAVQIAMRGGGYNSSGESGAAGFHWDHKGYSGDIIAYKLDHEGAERNERRLRSEVERLQQQLSNVVAAIAAYT